jgi:flagellar hook protein FlgE
MSLYGALFTGVSGLAAQSQALGIASNNIANVNTNGYKASQTQFSTLLPSRTEAGSVASGGVKATAQALIQRQGLIQTSDSDTDLALNGAGFFAVTDTLNLSPNKTELMYTRSGSFTQDADGFLKNAGGYYLQGWRLDQNGNLPANRNQIEPINLNQLTGTASQTTEINLRANLQASQAAFGGAYAPGVSATNMSSGAIPAHFERTLEIFDTQGGAQPVRLSFLKTAANTWQFEASYEGLASNVTSAVGIPFASGTVTFDSNGTVLTPAIGTPPVAIENISIPWSAASGLSAQPIALSFGDVGAATGLTQFNSASTLLSSGANGALFGGLMGIKVDETGVLKAIFDNGVQRDVFQLPVAFFQNPNGLSAVNGNAFASTDLSGDVTLLEATVGGAGTFSAAALEASTVNLAKEFTDLITIQRAYSASTKIITTADQMLDELIRIKR